MRGKYCAGFVITVALSISAIAVAAPSEPPNPPTAGPTHLYLETPVQIKHLDPPAPDSINWTTVITSVLAALVGAGGALIVGRRSINQSTNSAELKDLQGKLDTFYGPYMQRSEVNRLFAEELRSRQPSPGTFRTLTLLLDPDWRKRLSTSDQTIVEEIVANDRELSKLITEHAGLVDSQVMSYLARAGVHFRMMGLAFDGKLENTPGRFDRFVYPKQLDSVLRLEVSRLEKRCDELRKTPSKQHKPIAALRIPSDLKLPDWPSPPTVPLNVGT